MMPAPSLEQAAEQTIDLGLGADIDADRRLVEDEKIGAVVEPFADDDFLLVATGHRGGQHAAARRLDREVADLLVGVLPASSRPEIVIPCVSRS